MAQTLGYRPNLAARYLKAPRHLNITIDLPAQIASFFDLVRDGIRDAASSFKPGVDLSFRNHPVLGEGEVELFQKALQSGAKGIILSPGHPEELKPLIWEAAARSIPVVCVVTDAPGTDRLTTVSADPFTSGAIVAELFSRVLHNQGTIAVLTGDLSTCDHAEKVRGFESTLPLSDGRLKLSAVLENHDKAELAYSHTRDLLLHDRHLRGIYVSTANSLAVLRAIEEIDPERPLDVVTTDLFPQIIPFLRRGRILAIINQRPRTQGRMAFEALYRFLAEGKRPPATLKLNPHIVMRSNLDLFLEMSADAGMQTGSRGPRTGQEAAN